MNASSSPERSGIRLPLDPIRGIVSTSHSERWKKSALMHTLGGTLDRVNVLGSNSSGHTGCVNALSWTADGELLLSGGDDTTSYHCNSFVSVRVWRMDSSDTNIEYPFTCRSLIHTGHRNNIFNAHMLPHSTKIVTAAADAQVRVLEAGDAVGQSQNEVEYSSREACTRVLRCHSDRVKRVVTEDSPDLFLTVSEDGAVRQHDLRSSHRCGSECPSPVITVGHELSTLAMSPLTPYQFVVAGDSPFGYLFDRRYAGRSIDDEWGKVPEANGSDAALCVRRFGRSSTEQPGHSDHITGARMGVNNGHEVLLSYSSDAVYLFSTRDDPHDDQIQHSTTMLAPNAQKQEADVSGESLGSSSHTDSNHDIDTQEDEDRLRFPEDDEESGDQEVEKSQSDADWHPRVPVIHPIRRYAGACNVQTVKDVNFLGANEEYVTSGSDDGNFFLWRKDTGAIAGIYEGDSSVVNVIEGHPQLPVVAVSGIDTTIKLFAPVHGDSVSLWSKINQLDSIVARNATASERSMGRRINIAHLLLHYRRARVLLQEELAGDTTGYQCTPQ